MAHANKQGAMRFQKNTHCVLRIRSSIRNTEYAIRNTCRLLVVLWLCGCAGETAVPTSLPLPPATRPAAVWQPAPGSSWQWQLTGPIDTSLDVAMYDVDLFETPQATIDALHADGRIVVCYFSAGSWEDWRPDANAFAPALRGKPLAGWPDERWLDVRQLPELAPPIAARLDLAVTKGCDGVEPDNVDGYQNDSGFPLTAADQLAFNTWLANEAHARGLSVGLKNDLDQVPQLEPYFDWALNEQCVEYAECDRLLPFVLAGKAVFGVEYTGDAAEFCPVVNDLNFDWLHKRQDLDAWRRACR